MRIRRVTTFRRGIWFAVGFATAAFAFYAYQLFWNSELAEKPVWAMLQSLEYRHRGDANASESVLLNNVSGSGYMIVGLPTGDAQFPRVWIILNEAAPFSSVYIMPGDHPFSLSCSFVEDLGRKTKVVRQVWFMLMRHCTR
jgi:hypothetical protein